MYVRKKIFWLAPMHGLLRLSRAPRDAAGVFGRCLSPNDRCEEGGPMGARILGMNLLPPLARGVLACLHTMSSSQRHVVRALKRLDAPFFFTAFAIRAARACAVALQAANFSVPCNGGRCGPQSAIRVRCASMASNRRP